MRFLYIIPQKLYQKWRQVGFIGTCKLVLKRFSALSPATRNTGFSPDLPTYHEEIAMAHQVFTRHTNLFASLAKSWPSPTIGYLVFPSDAAKGKEEDFADKKNLSGFDQPASLIWLDSGGQKGLRSSLAKSRVEYWVAFPAEMEPDVRIQLALAAYLNADPGKDLWTFDFAQFGEESQEAQRIVPPRWNHATVFSNPRAFPAIVLKARLLKHALSKVEHPTGRQFSLDDLLLALGPGDASPSAGHIPLALMHRRMQQTLPGAGRTQSEYAGARKRISFNERPQGFDLKENENGTFQRRRVLKKRPSVSVVIPTDDRGREVEEFGNIKYLPNLVRSLTKSSYTNFEIIVADNGNLSQASQAAIKDIPHKLVSFSPKPGNFNFSRKINFAAKHAEGEYLVILNDDMQLINADWIEALLDCALDPAVGVVGGKLLYPDDSLQHAGLMFNSAGDPIHLFHRMSASLRIANPMVNSIMDLPMVTGACLMTKRKYWQDLRGFDEQLAIDFNDVDFCLRSIKAGRKIRYTPFCELYHFDQGTLSGRSQNPKEVERFKTRWSDEITKPEYVLDLTMP